MISGPVELEEIDWRDEILLSADLVGKLQEICAVADKDGEEENDRIEEIEDPPDVDDADKMILELTGIEVELVTGPEELLPVVIDPVGVTEAVEGDVGMQEHAEDILEGTPLH